ncbi:unnamed protein product [Colletotrichum noveboracense]|uniref:Ankyrin repeat protein n=1 Tax=Colletotrichum noveboracense TaxID=2664923 RepID=A0A9W4WFV0_9PEZI|nr:unnamed protein product [Colletotrichum noveboracense]
MDPSGIIGIIGVAGQILATCTKLGLNWRDAPDDAKKFKSEVDALHKTLWEIYNHLIQNPDFITAFEGKHSAVLSNLAAPPNSDDSALLFTCKEELEDVLKALQKRLGGSRFGWERLKATFSNEKTQSAIENVQRRCQHINSKILIDNTAITVDTNLVVRSARNELTERHLDENKRRTLDRITSIDFSKQLADNLERRQDGTGLWLLESPEFQTWVQGDRQTLFCPGMPGAGKTMLSSIVIEYLQRRFIGNSSVGVGFMFCNFRRHDEQTPRSLLSSVLKQLYWAMPSGCSDVEKIYNNGSSSPSRREIEECLQSVTSQFTRVYILVDALDEFGEDRGILLKSILSVQETENVNIFTTSRHIPEIEIYFNEATSIEIRATDEDVMRFLDGRMSRLPSAARKSRELQGEIKHSIVEAVQGMFLLAQLYFDSLGSSAYDNAYDEAMERIEGQFEDQEMLAKEALSWIVCARRPLKTLELQHALAVERGTTELDEDNITELEDIVSVCAGLITIDEESDIIRLVHYTTQEYFQRTTERWLPSAQHLIVESFMTYFSFNAFSVGSCHDDSYLESRLEEYPLYEYATLEWGHHAQSILPPSESVISFLMDGQSNLEAAFEVIWYRGRIPDFRTKRPPMELSGLHLAAYFGLKEAFTMIIDRFGPEIDINVRDGGDFTPLFYAVMGGNTDFIAWLLSIDKIELGPKGKEHPYTPVKLAATIGDMAGILPFIKSDKVDLNTKEIFGNTPLATAVTKRWINIVKALIESGRVDVNLQNNQKQTPLSHAAESGYVEGLRFLLGSAKANANEADIFGETPLYTALHMGQQETARLLLDSGQVDVSLSIESVRRRTPLDQALLTFGHDHSITKLLVHRMKLIGISTEATIKAWEDFQKFPYASADNISDIHITWFHKYELAGTFQ